jgi:hypothetical protein
MNLSGRLVPIDQLRKDDVDRMFGLMTEHYEGVDRRRFLGDLEEKQGCMVLSDRDGTIWGFSSYVFLHTTYDGDAVCTLFSGDTVIDGRHWGSPQLFRTFAGLLSLMLRRHSDRSCWWFLLTQGIRTYLMLPLGFHTFVPRYDMCATEREVRLLSHLGRLKCGKDFDPETGIVRSRGYYLKEEYAPSQQRRAGNPHLRFFLERNPGHRRGDELACLCPIRPDNFRRRTAEMVGVR